MSDTTPALFDARPREEDASAFEQAMDEWVALFASRDEVAEEYASCLREFPTEWDRWPDFDAAILRRWSPAGLSYIKQRARYSNRPNAWVIG